MNIKFINGSVRDVVIAPNANLRYANLHSTDLSGANLSCANLSGADLSCANLSGADLSCANLHRTDLSGTDLSGADLRHVDLRGVDLRGADLRYADLSYADLRHADLSGTDLSGANLRRANLRDANLSDAKGLEQQCIVPAGVLIGYKKLADGSIMTLRIPAKAARVNAYGSRKCRAQYAVVVSGAGASLHRGMQYPRKGKTVRPDKWDPDPRVECSHGIHFFITREEAEAY